MEIKFLYGCLAEPLEIQANKQGFTLGDNAEKFEKIRTAISMCGFHVATDSQVSAMRKELHSQIVDSLKEWSK